MDVIFWAQLNYIFRIEKYAKNNLNLISQQADTSSKPVKNANDPICGVIIPLWKGESREAEAGEKNSLSIKRRENKYKTLWISKLVQM